MSDRPDISPDEPVLVLANRTTHGEHIGICVSAREGQQLVRQVAEFQAKAPLMGVPLPMDAQSVADRLRALADWLCPAKKGKKRKSVANPVTSLADRVRMVWAAYVEVFGKQRSKIDDKRRRYIERQLQAGYTAQDLHQCFVGYSKSPFHMGENDRHRRFDSIDLLLRDAAHVDAGLDLYEQNRGKPPPGGPNGPSSGGGRPEDRWDSLSGEPDGAPGAGGLPRAGKGAAKGGEDHGSVAPGADAGKLREAGEGRSYGLRFD